MSDTITSWSISRFNDYQQCPFKAKLKHIDKLTEPPNPAMVRGSQVHAYVDNYIKGNLDFLPDELTTFASLLDSLRNRYIEQPDTIMVESSWAFTKEWQQTKWLAKDCWLRLKVDIAYFETPEHLVLIDWKTGKFLPENVADYQKQLELYSVASFVKFSDVNNVSSKLVYLDEGFIYPNLSLSNMESLEFNRNDHCESLKTNWEIVTEPMLTDTIFHATPSDKCRWCHFRKENRMRGGGQCCY